MKKTSIFLAALVALALTSCRETTEVNTDGNMEENDSTVETVEE